MTVQNVVDLAKYGELRQLKLNDNANGEVTGFINLGLIELYKRFNLKTREQIIRLGYTQKLAIDGTDEEFRTGYKSYIADTTTTISTMYKLNNDLLTIDGMYNSYGQVYNLNNEYDYNSAFTSGYGEIQIPNSISGEYVSIVYVASPDIMVNTTDVVPIPDSMLEALLFYIGYRGHGSMDGAINTEANSHLMRFEASCKKIESLGMVTPDNAVRTDIKEKGFV